MAKKRISWKELKKSIYGNDYIDYQIKKFSKVKKIK